MTSILISGFVSLSLTPVPVQPLPQAVPTEHHGAMYNASEKFFDGMRDLYGWTLKGVVKHRFITLLGAIGTLVVTVYLYGLVPKGFIPSQDTGVPPAAKPEFPQDASFDAMVITTTARDARRLRSGPSRRPGLHRVCQTLTSNTGRLTVTLKPRTQRKLTPDAGDLDELRPKLATGPVGANNLTNSPLVRIRRAE